jgi:phosphopantothenate synthetase
VLAKCSEEKLEVSIFKKGEKYKRSKVLETFDNKKAVYVYSNLKSDDKNLPTYLYERFIIDSDELDELEYSFNEFFEF